MKTTKTLTIFILLLAAAYTHTTESHQPLAAYNPIPYLRTLSYEDSLTLTLGSYAISSGAMALLIKATQHHNTVSAPALFAAVALLIGNIKWADELLTKAINKSTQQPTPAKII